MAIVRIVRAKVFVNWKQADQIPKNKIVVIHLKENTTNPKISYTDTETQKL